MSSLTDKERQVLDLLVRHPDGCDETVLLIGGVTAGHISGLVLDGFATMQPTVMPVSERIVVWVRITEAGQKAIAE